MGDDRELSSERSGGHESAAALLERLVAVHRELKMGTASCQLNPLFAAHIKRIDDELVSTIDALRLWIGDSCVVDRERRGPETE
jgi:hypothetical protein